MLPSVRQPHVLRAMAEVAATGEWQVIEAWYAEVREKLILSICHQSDATSRQAQGALLAMDEFFQQVRGARPALETQRANT